MNLICHNFMWCEVETRLESIRKENWNVVSDIVRRRSRVSDERRHKNFEIAMNSTHFKITEGQRQFRSKTHQFKI